MGLGRKAVNHQSYNWRRKRRLYLNFPSNNYFDKEGRNEKAASSFSSILYTLPNDLSPLRCACHFEKWPNVLTLYIEQEQNFFPSGEFITKVGGRQHLSCLQFMSMVNLPGVSTLFRENIVRIEANMILLLIEEFLTAVEWKPVCLLSCSSAPSLL